MVLGVILVIVRQKTLLLVGKDMEWISVKDRLPEDRGFLSGYENL
jgi:hypothetical protein